MPLAIVVRNKFRDPKVAYLILSETICWHAEWGGCVPKRALTAGPIIHGGLGAKRDFLPITHSPYAGDGRGLRDTMLVI
jgi:hypothetical protein